MAAYDDEPCIIVAGHSALLHIWSRRLALAISPSKCVVIALGGDVDELRRWVLGLRGFDVAQVSQSGQPWVVFVGTDAGMRQGGVYRKASARLEEALVAGVGLRGRVALYTTYVVSLRRLKAMFVAVGPEMLDHHQRASQRLGPRPIQRIPQCLVALLHSNDTLGASFVLADPEVETQVAMTRLALQSPSLDVCWRPWRSSVTTSMASCNRITSGTGVR